MLYIEMFQLDTLV